MGALYDKFRYRFIGDVSSNDGCPTCGYGSEYGMSESEYKDLLAEIDKWVAETFVEKK